MTLGLDRSVARFTPIFHEQRDYRRFFGTITMTVAVILLSGTVVTLTLYGCRDLIARFVQDDQALALLLVLIFLAPIQALDEMLNNLFAVFAKPRAIFFRRYLLAPGLAMFTALVVGAVIPYSHPIGFADGTTVTLHLTPADPDDGLKDYTEPFVLKDIVKRYSDFVAYPVKLGDETLNSMKAIWARSKDEVTEDEHREFYRHISHDWTDPLEHIHVHVEGAFEARALLYLPSKAPFDLHYRDGEHRGLQLYVKRVFIMDDAEALMPVYLRFVKGVLDTRDLSLNVSRELLQQDPKVEKIKSALTKRALDMLGKLAKDKEAYQGFWNTFGSVLKEGPAEDFANRDKIAGLLRFSTTHTDSATQDQSLADYVGRMKEGQDKIYYIVADGFNAAKSSPHLEIFRKKGIEVLLLHDRIDEWLMSHLTEFDGKRLVDVAKGDLDLGEVEGEEEKKAQEETAKAKEALVKRVKEALGEQTQEVRVTHRLTDSPACVVLPEHEMGYQMRRIMEAAGQPLPEVKPILELNPAHPLVERLEAAQGDAFADLAHVLLDQAIIAEGGHLDDPAAYVRRLNGLLTA